MKEKILLEKEPLTSGEALLPFPLYFQHDVDAPIVLSCKEQWKGEKRTGVCGPALLVFFCLKPGFPFHVKFSLSFNSCFFFRVFSLTFEHIRNPFILMSL